MQDKVTSSKEPQMVAGKVLSDGTKAVTLYTMGGYRTMLYINVAGHGRATLEKRDCEGSWDLEPIIDEPKTAQQIAITIRKIF